MPKAKPTKSRRRPLSLRRQVTYSLDVAKIICGYVERGYNLKDISDQEGMPTYDQLKNWTRDKRLTFQKDFSLLYRAAQRIHKNLAFGSFDANGNKKKYRYTLRLARRIQTLKGNGQTLIAICNNPRMPSYEMVSRWIGDPSLPWQKEFKAMMDKADKIAATWSAERILDLASDAYNPKDSASVRNAMNAHKWKIERHEASRQAIELFRRETNETISDERREAIRAVLKADPSMADLVNNLAKAIRPKTRS